MKTARTPLATGKGTVVAFKSARCNQFFLACVCMVCMVVLCDEQQRGPSLVRFPPAMLVSRTAQRAPSRPRRTRTAGAGERDRERQTETERESQRACEK